MPIFYIVVLLFLAAAYNILPLDLLHQGRATYLENVAASRIEYYFDDSNRIGFALNRAVTFMSLLAPVNLVIRSAFYAPFVLLQLFLTWRLLAVFRRSSSQFVLASAHVVLTFTFVSALFEPDYGSYFRHKVGVLLFTLVVLLDWREAHVRPVDADSGPAPKKRLGTRPNTLARRSAN